MHLGLIIPESNFDVSAATNKMKCGVCKKEIIVKYCLQGLSENYNHAECEHPYFCSNDCRNIWMDANWRYAV